MGIIGIVAIGAAVALFFGWWMRRPDPAPANKVKGGVDPSVLLALKAAMLTEEIAQTRQTLDQEIEVLAQGRLPADAEMGISPAGSVSKEDGALDELRTFLKDPLRARPIPFRAEVVRAQKEKLLSRIQHEWTVFAGLQQRYERERRSNAAAGALVQLGLITDLHQELEGLRQQLDVDALHELVVRNHDKVLVNREAVQEQIARSRMELERQKDVDVIDLARAKAAFAGQLDLFDLQTLREEDWSGAANAAGRAMREIRQIAERIKLQPQERRALIAEMALFDVWVAGLRRFVVEVVAQGYVPSAGSAEAVLAPFERRYEAWKGQCMERVELFGNEREELQKFFQDLCALGQHVGIWIFRQERDAYRVRLAEGAWKLEASCRLLRSRWAKESRGIDVVREGLLEQAAKLQADIRTYQLGGLSRFCAGPLPPTEADLRPYFEPFRGLMERLERLHDVVRDEVSHLRPRTGMCEAATVA